MTTDQIKSIDEIKLDDFIKFVDKDKAGKITYVGKVVGIDKNWVSIESFYGLFGFKICAENALFLDEKPVGWDKFSKDPDKFRKDLKDKEKSKDFAPEVKTQKEIILDIVKANKKQPRPKLLKLLKKEFPDVADSSLKTQLDLALLKV